MKEIERFNGKIFRLVSREVEINHQPANRDIVLHPGGVALSCIQDGKILLVSQFRHAVNAQLLEIPAGTLEPGEDPKVCGLRELNEETGYTCDSCELIQIFYPTPGYTSECLYIYQCTGLKKAEIKLEQDADEVIETVWMDLDEAFKKAWNSEIRDAKTILAIYHAVLERGK